MDSAADGSTTSLVNYRSLSVLHCSTTPPSATGRLGSLSCEGTTPSQRPHSLPTQCRLCCTTTTSNSDHTHTHGVDSVHTERVVLWAGVLLSSARGPLARSHARALVLRRTKESRGQHTTARQMYAVSVSSLSLSLSVGREECRGCDGGGPWRPPGVQLCRTRTLAKRTIALGEIS